MRILLVADDFKPAIGGVAEYQHELATELVSLGNQVLVIAGRIEGAEAFDEEASYQVRRILPLRTRKNLVTRYWLVKDAVCDFRAEVLLATSLLPESMVAQVAARSQAIPFGQFVYGRDLGRLLRDRMGKNPLTSQAKKWLILHRVIRKADLMFAISSFTAGLLQAAGVSDPRIVMVPPAIRLTGEISSWIAGAREIEDSSRRTLLTVGRLVERKGVDTVLRALPKILAHFPEARYIVVGDGPYRHRLRELVNELRLSHQVTFAGTVNDIEKWRFYKTANLFVMPNRELPSGEVEGFGIVFLEANAFGLPVIAGRSGGAVDAVLDFETGLLVDPDNVDEVADTVIRLLRDGALAERLGKRGQQRVRHNCTWRQSAETVQQHLARLSQAS